ncbi:adenosine deaminase [Brevundimonas sp. 2R-24]|uniref:adenosine deaminase n=1 Tax=Peiella sedimenti TaxID=3061083 RepID=A0ABT8SP01_9CAUL|nr:adenosine deaminase [Caulobacteraceae bacterium XZ-24]
MRGIIGGFVGLAAALAAGVALAAEPDLQAMSRAELTAFTRAMPKGGDVHIHLSGAPYPETYLEWAAEDGLCIDTVRLALAPPCQPEGDLVSARGISADLRAQMMDSLSTRRPGFAGRTGHDQFFTAFDRFGATPDARRGDMLADLMQTLAMQNTFYLEVMWMPQSGAARRAGTAAGWNEDFRAMDAALTPALPALVEAARAETDAMEARARELLRCDAGASAVVMRAAMAGCQVTVRYLVQANRLVPPEQTYGQLALGRALIAADPRWVGLQLVAPEDHPNALANYDTHMAMFSHFTRQGLAASLHAGELTLDYATPLSIDDHVTEAVAAGARRIGHGIAIPHERDAYALVARMAAEDIAVEVNLTSNDVILNVEGEEHPVIWLRQAGVPVIYTTDDPGISRIDLSHEYARAVSDTGATYRDLVTSARNAIAFGFLPGEGLWLDPGEYRRPRPECAADLRDGARSDDCEAFLNSNAKAREQYRYERLLAIFEAERGIR